VHAREARLEDVAGNGVLQARQTLECLEAFLLRLDDGREGLTGRSDQGAGVEVTVVRLGQ